MGTGRRDRARPGRMDLHDTRMADRTAPGPRSCPAPVTRAVTPGTGTGRQTGQQTPPPRNDGQKAA